MSEHWCAPQGDGPFARVIYDALAATMERAARTHRCEWCGTHGYGTLGPCSPPTKDLTGITTLGVFGGPTPFQILEQRAQEWRDDWAQRDWQTADVIWNELKKKES